MLCITRLIMTGFFLKCLLWNVSEGSGFENFTRNKVNAAHLSNNHRCIVILEGWYSENGNMAPLQEAR